jgi:hypothetical protein
MNDKNDDLRLHVRDYIFREGDNVSQRIDWSLIFHAILLEALFAAPKLRYSIPILCLGLSVSWLWFLVGIRQNWTINLLHHALTRVPAQSMNLKLLEERLRQARDELQPKWYRWVRATPNFAVVIPAFTVLTWFYLFFAFSFTKNVAWYVYMIPFVVLIGTPCLSRKTDNLEADEHKKKAFVDSLVTPVKPNKEMEKP